MKKAFTLIEILIVISILTILIAIVFPIFKSIKVNSYETKSLSNLRQIGLAWKMYSEDYDDMMMRFFYEDEFVYWFGDKNKSILSPYVNIRQLKDPGMSFYKINYSDFWPGYGYNGVYLSCCDNDYNIIDVNYNQINNHSNTIVFSTNAGIFKVNKIEGLYPIALIYPPSYGLPSVHGRYNEKAPVLWADLHASSKKIKYFKKNNSYNVGFLDMDNDPNTDELFDLQ